MFENIKHRLNRELLDYFSKVNEFKIIDQKDDKTYYIFYKSDHDLENVLIYDPYSEVLLKGDENCAPNESLSLYLVHVVEQKKMTLEEFCEWEGVVQIP